MLTSQGAGLVDPVGVFIYLFIYSILDSNYVLLLCKKPEKKEKKEKNHGSADYFEIQ